MIRSLVESAPVRKGQASILAIAKFLHRISSSEFDYSERPPIIVNSLPKSGTHLLLQMVSGLPGYSRYGGFIATTPTLTMHRRNDEALSRKIARLAPGEVCGAHLYYSESIAEALRQRGAISLFIYRDPRDVFWSEMQYLLTMNPWHRGGRYARRIRDSNDRFEFFLYGTQRLPAIAFEWPSFANRIEPYLGWLEDSESFSCRYEGFQNSVQLKDTVDTLAAHLRANIPIAGRHDHAAIVNGLLDAIRPEDSHTFRSGKKHEWRTKLTQRQISALEEEVAFLLPLLAG